MTYHEDQAKGRAEARRYAATIRQLMRDKGDPVGDLGRLWSRIMRELKWANMVERQGMSHMGWYGFGGFFSYWRPKIEQEISWAQRRAA